MKQCIFEKSPSGNRITKIRLDVFNPTPFPRPPKDSPGYTPPKFRLIKKYIEGDYIVFVHKEIIPTRLSV